MFNEKYYDLMRTYRDLCGIARALDVVGERWALLVVRELLFGPKRFADLHRGLPGMSQNVLTQRLRELEGAQVLTRRRGLPPTPGMVYELTDHGRDLEPVLLALGRWGSPLSPRPDSRSELSPDALVVALGTTFDPDVAVGVDATVQLNLPGDAFVLTVHGRRFNAVRGEQPADAVLEATVRAVQALVFDGQPLDEAVRLRDARVDGDTATLARLLATFDDRRPAQGSQQSAPHPGLRD